MVFVLTKELGMNNIIKEAAGFKRTYFSILCTGGTVASQLAWSPLDQVVQDQALAAEIVLCSETGIWPDELLGSYTDLTILCTGESLRLQD